MIYFLNNLEKKYVSLFVCYLDLKKNFTRKHASRYEKLHKKKKEENRKISLISKKKLLINFDIIYWKKFVNIIMKNKFFFLLF